MTKSETDRLARIVWDYMQLGNKPKKRDAILVLGSLDTRVAERGAQLFLDGYGDYIIFSGDSGQITKDHFDKSEAETFADIAMRMGVPRNKIIIERRSTNTGENIAFSYDMLRHDRMLPKSMILVQKPYMERRTYATFKKQWPDPKTEITVTSPQISYDDYFDEANPKDRVLNIMVGDLQRIREYPGYGYQIEQDIPDDVWSAYEQLVKLGYDKHLVRPARQDKNRRLAKLIFMVALTLSVPVFLYIVHDFWMATALFALYFPFVYAYVRQLAEHHLQTGKWY